MYKYTDNNRYGKPYIYIHPHKQKAVKYLVDNITGDVEYIVIFGSSVHPTCKNTSDIDVCIVTSDPESLNRDSLKMKGESYDFLVYKSLSDIISSMRANPVGVAADIIRKGVVVYDRQKDLIRPS